MNITDIQTKGFLDIVSSERLNAYQLVENENIINHKLGIQNCYSIIEKNLSYKSKDYLNLLINISRFQDIIKQKT